MDHVDDLLIYKGKQFSEWIVVNDTVMGGASSAYCEALDSGLLLNGSIVEENGGFVSCKSPLLSNAIGVEQPSFHVGLIAFGLLYSPISEITGLIMNYVSRVFEYQADDYAKNTYKAEPLITSLKKLSKNSLSNLTPHKAYVFMHYSHPTLLDRVRNLKN